MLNFEKNIDKLIYLIQESNDCAEFLALTGERCNQVSCYECAEILKKWLSTKYVPPKINWDNVPIDTKIIVWDCEERKLKRHFAGISDDTHIETYAGGGTSWTTDEIENWNFAELPKEEETNE